MYTIVGKKIAKGEFNGKQYHNINLQCTYERPNDTAVSGLLVIAVKVKAELCPDIKIGQCVDFLYDQYGNVVLVTVVN